MEIVNSAVTHSEFASVFSVHENSAFLNSLKTEVIDVYQQKVVEVLETKPNLLSLQAKIVKIGRPLIKLATIVKNNYMGNMDGQILGSRICNPISVMHELSDRVIVHDHQTQVLLNKFLKASLATSIKEISRILFNPTQKNNKYHESTAKMYDYDKKPKKSHLPFNSEVADATYNSEAYDNYVLTRSHLLKNVCDEQIREYIFLKSLLPIEHWFVQSVQDLSLTDLNLRSELDNLEVLSKENLVLFKKVRLMKLDEVAELSDRAQKEKLRCLEEKKRADLVFREVEDEVKRKRMEEIEEGIREKEEWIRKEIEGDGMNGENYEAEQQKRQEILENCKQELIEKYEKMTVQAETRIETARRKLTDGEKFELDKVLLKEAKESVEEGDSDVENEEIDVKIIGGKIMNLMEKIKNCESETVDETMGDTMCDTIDETVVDFDSDIEGTCKTGQKIRNLIDNIKFGESEDESIETDGDLTFESDTPEKPNNFEFVTTTKTPFFKLNENIIQKQFLPESIENQAESEIDSHDTSFQSNALNSEPHHEPNSVLPSESIPEYIKRSFTQPVTKMLNLINQTAISHYLIHYQLLEIFEEIHNFVFLKNAHFRQILLEPIFENSINNCNFHNTINTTNNSANSSFNNSFSNTAINSISPLILSKSVTNAFLQATGKSEPKLLKSYFLQSFNFSNLAILSPFQIISNLQVEFSTKTNQIITKNSLKHYTLLSKLMIKMAFTKYQLNRREIINHKTHMLEFYKMRHIVGCLEQYISHVISSFHSLFLERLESKQVQFNDVRNLHDTFIADIFSALGSKNDGSGQIFSLIDRLFRIISRCCEAGLVEDEFETLSVEACFREYRNISSLFINMIRKIAELKHSSIMQMLLVQVDFNGYYSKQ